MDIVTVYSPSIKQWDQEKDELFIGAMEENLIYTLGITPPDPTDRSCVLFNITLEKEIINTSTKKRLFYANVWYCFKVRNNGEVPTPDLYFMLIDSATKSFEIKYKEKTAGTIITGRPTTTTPYDVLLPSINETISFWNMNHRSASLN